MSKSNGNRHYKRLPTADELREIVKEGQELMKLLPRDWTAEQTGEDSTRYPRFEVKSAEPWRNTHHKKFFNDICQVKGGLSRRSEAIANWIAWARNTLPILFTVITRLQKVTPDEKYQPEMGAYKPDAGSDRVVRFLELIAEAFEVLGFNKNNLGHHAGDRIIGSDRKYKAELLRRLADFIDPVNDAARLRELHHQERVPANGLPTNKDLRQVFLPTKMDFRNVLPESLCRVLDDEEFFDKEMERAQLDATAQRKWELPSDAIRLYIRARMASHDAWGHFENHHVPDSFVPSEYVPSKYRHSIKDDHLRKCLDDMMRHLHARAEYFKEDVAALTYQIGNDLGWLRKNKDTEDAIFKKIMSGESTGVDAFWDLDSVINNWDFVPLT